MTFPNGAQPQLQLIVCPDCGSVRVPVPSIVAKIMTLAGQQTIVPCPVCEMWKMYKAHVDMHGLEAEEPA